MFRASSLPFMMGVRVCVHTFLVILPAFPAFPDLPVEIFYMFPKRVSFAYCSCFDAQSFMRRLLSSSDKKGEANSKAGRV